MRASTGVPAQPRAVLHACRCASLRAHARKSVETDTPADTDQPPILKPGAAWLSDREVRAVVGALRRLSHACEVLGNGDPRELAEAIRLDELATRIERRAGPSPRRAFERTDLDGPPGASTPVPLYRRQRPCRA